MKSYGQCLPGGSLTVRGIPTPQAPTRRLDRDALTLHEARPRRHVPTKAQPTSADLRAWGIANGFALAAWGAIPSKVRDAYQAAREAGK